jgi:hypothetical protein
MKNIIVKFITDRELRLTINETLTVSELKKIVINSMIAKGEISLIFKGEVLNDDVIIANLPDIESNYIIGHIKRNKREPLLFKENSDFTFFHRPSIGRLIAMRNEHIRNMQRSATPDPPNFEEMVGNLIEMGFEKDECERALRAAHFNPDSAATMLLSGNLQREAPKPTLTAEDLEFALHQQESQKYNDGVDQFQETMSDTNMRNYEEDEEDIIQEEEEEYDIQDHFDLLVDTNEDMSSLSDSSNLMYDEYEEEEEGETQEGENTTNIIQTRPTPAYPQVIKAKPRTTNQNNTPNLPFLSDNHHDPPSRTPLPVPPVPQNISNAEMNRPDNNNPESGLVLTPIDRNKINSLIQLTGVDFSTASQVYIICNKDLEAARQCLIH